MAEHNTQDKKVDTDVSERITLHDIYKTLWKCRDFELSHLWQRSIFLVTFITLLFTGYGCLTPKFYDYFQDNCTASLSALIYISALAIGISVCGIVMSVLWIMMGKGSKAWYEEYEEAICKIEETKLEKDQTSKYSTTGVDELRKEKLMHGMLVYWHDDFNDNIFSTAGGAYSVSKINIFIGQFLLGVWSILYVVHSVIMLSSPAFRRCESCATITIEFCAVTLLLILVVVFLVLRSNNLKSTSLCN